MKNYDNLIVEAVESNYFKCDEDGTIYSSHSPTGEKLDSSWRRLEFTSKSYRRLMYRGMRLRAHRLIYYYFKRHLDSSLHINHIDGNPANNSIKNLELVSASENSLHAYRVLNRPAVYGNAKLSSEHIKAAKILVSNGMSACKVAQLFGVAKSTMSYALNGRTWADKNGRHKEET